MYNVSACVCVRTCVYVIDFKYTRTRTLNDRLPLSVVNHQTTRSQNSDGKPKVGKFDVIILSCKLTERPTDKLDREWYYDSCHFDNNFVIPITNT